MNKINDIDEVNQENKESTEIINIIGEKLDITINTANTENIIGYTKT